MGVLLIEVKCAIFRVFHERPLKGTFFNEKSKTQINRLNRSKKVCICCLFLLLYLSDREEVRGCRHTDRRCHGSVRSRVICTERVYHGYRHKEQEDFHGKKQYSYSLKSV